MDTLIAQRLTRTFCKNCVKMAPVSREDRELLEKYTKEVSAVTGKTYPIPSELPTAQGCKVCNHTGYLGRVVIAEVIRLDNDLKQMILDKESTYKLQEAAYKKGMISMFMDGIIKVTQGITSLAEVLRVSSK